ncbi:hypothetical protein C791_8348 [Amycolatopsis azurea DSM 43854]|uniref:Uncharacterized protein n=1 Tax=Amycolatopsis azurea DSM 43854 TaxID=1238180 RepID=M2Q6Y7_9PSEU|nr:hypothetical protein C791_8348 [Amycolatopsis azurea DSM 43854]
MTGVRDSGRHLKPPRFVPDSQVERSPPGSTDIRKLPTSTLLVHRPPARTVRSYTKGREGACHA